MTPFGRSHLIALIVAATILIISRAGFTYAQRALGAYLKKSPVPLRAELARIPKVLESWESRTPDLLMDEAVLETLGTRAYVARTYTPVDGDGPPIRLHVAYYTGLIDPVPHVPDRCFVAAGLNARDLPRNLSLPLDTSGWRTDESAVNRATGEPYRITTVLHPITGERLDVALPVGEPELRAVPFGDPQQPTVSIFAGYFFVANGRLTPTPDRVRLLAFDLGERYAYYCKVDLMVATTSSMTRDQFVAHAARFLDELLPELMRCLPDWRAVENSAAPAAARPRD